MMCVDPLRVSEQMIKYMKVNTSSGAELHAYLVCDGICTCKVGFPSKNHAKEDANLLDSEYVVVTHVVTAHDCDIAKQSQMYEFYGSAITLVITPSQAERD